VDPQRADYVDVRTAIRVNRDQPTSVPVRTAGTWRLREAGVERRLHARPVERGKVVQLCKVANHDEAAGVMGDRSRHLQLPEGTRIVLDDETVPATSMA
jgi:hypothetical protein